MTDTPPSATESTSAGAAARRGVFWLLAVYWAALFIATHVPLPAGTLPGNSDKLAHLAAYGVLAALLTSWQILRGTSSGAALLRTVFVAAAYGALDELLQIPSGRQAEIADWVADVTGALIGGALAVSSAAALRYFSLGRRH